MENSERSKNNDNFLKNKETLKQLKEVSSEIRQDNNLNLNANVSSSNDNANQFYDKLAEMKKRLAMLRSQKHQT